MTPSALKVACSRCDAANRIPAARLAEDPNCGRCGAALLDGRPIELTDANFDSVTGRTELPLLIDFWAGWCGPCKMMAPQFDQAARQLKGRALLAKVDVDASPQTAQRFGIRSIPTLVRLDAGRETARSAGAQQAAQIVAMAG